jgi:osmotically-inducible protein OsmY
MKTDLEARHQLTDSEVAAEALDSIQWITTVPIDSLKVVARDGWVFLDGTVKTWPQKEAIQQVVQHLEGVNGVSNAILVAN